VIQNEDVMMLDKLHQRGCVT